VNGNTTTIVILPSKLLKVVCPTCKRGFEYQYSWGTRLHLTCPRPVCDADISVSMRDRTARLMDND